MRVKLIPNAGRVLRRSLTSHILIVAGLLTAAEAALPYMTDLIPLEAFPYVMLAVVFAAFIARYILQESLHDD